MLLLGSLHGYGSDVQALAGAVAAGIQQAVQPNTTTSAVHAKGLLAALVYSYVAIILLTTRLGC